MIRLATFADYKAIAHVHLTSWHEAFSQFYPEYVQHRGDQTEQRLRLWHNILSEDKTVVYVSVDTEGVVNGVGEGGAAKYTYDDYDGELHRLYVAPAAQGKGIGRALVLKVAQHLLDDGYQAMLVAAWAVNKPARHFYEKLDAVFIERVQQERDAFNTAQAVYGWSDLATWLNEQT